MTKWNALSCFSLSSPIRTVPRVNGRASVNGWNVTDAGAFGCTVIVLRFQRAAVEVEMHLKVVDRRRTAIHDAGRHGDALLAGKDRALRQHRRHGQVRRLRIGDRHRREDGALGQPKILVAHPAVALEVADHHDFAAGQRRFGEHALRQLQARARSASLRR